MLLPTTITARVGKTGKTVELNVADLSDEMVGALLQHGFQQRVTDCNAGASKAGSTDDAMFDAAIAERDAFIDGSARFGTGGGGARLTDLEREIRSVVATALQKKLGRAAKPKEVLTIVNGADKTSAKWLSIVSKAEAALAAKSGLSIDDLI